MAAAASDSPSHWRSCIDSTERSRSIISGFPIAISRRSATRRLLASPARIRRGWCAPTAAKGSVTGGAAAVSK